MQTAKQARHSSFQRGQGAYACRCCDRQTRDTGDNGQVQLCPECYELAGFENLLSDNGSLGDYIGAARQMLNSLASKVGVEKTESCFPTIVSALQAADVPADDQPVPVHADLTTDTEYYVHVTGFGHDELVLVQARAARFARRYVKQQYRDAAHSLEGLTFSAHRAI